TFFRHRLDPQTLPSSQSESESHLGSGKDLTPGLFGSVHVPDQHACSGTQSEFDAQTRSAALTHLPQRGPEHEALHVNSCLPGRLHRKPPPQSLVQTLPILAFTSSAARFFSSSIIFLILAASR